MSSYKVNLFDRQLVSRYILLMKTTDEKTPKKVTGVRLDPALLKELKLLAVHLDRTVTNILEEAARMFIEKYTPQK